jgi:hypothetical protein
MSLLGQSFFTKGVDARVVIDELETEYLRTYETYTIWKLKQ